MDKMIVKVDVVDEDICRNCRKFKITDSLQKMTDAYGFEHEERVIECVHRELCEQLLEHISAEKFLHID